MTVQVKHQKVRASKMTTVNQQNLGRPGATLSGEREFTYERVFNAPRALVFAMFGEAQHLQHWWGPTGWTLPVCDIDFRPGGVWLYCMRGPDGTEGWGRAVYQEIVPPERIVYQDSFADAEGNVLEGMPQMVIRIEFHDLGSGKTRVRTSTEFASVADLQQTLEMGMVEGLGQTWDRLETYLATQEGAAQGKAHDAGTLTLPSDREIRMTRLFDAPAALLFQTLTDPKLIPQWWGRGTVVDKYDFRVGGAWRFVQHDDAGNEEGFRGEIREIVPPERLVQTFEWEGMVGHVVIETTTLEEVGNGKTRLTTVSLFSNTEDRDGMLHSGMEGGANESWDRLAALVAKQQAAATR